MIVSDGLTDSVRGITELSPTNRRLTSWDSPCGLTTERLGSLPILQPPCTWVAGAVLRHAFAMRTLAGGGGAGAGSRLAWPRAAGGGVAARGWRDGGGGPGVAGRGWRDGTAQAPRALAESERWISTSGPRRSAANVRASRPAAGERADARTPSPGRANVTLGGPRRLEDTLARARRAFVTPDRRGAPKVTLARVPAAVSPRPANPRPAAAATPTLGPATAPPPEPRAPQSLTYAAAAVAARVK